jgi:hypothetical protein
LLWRFREAPPAIPPSAVDTKSALNLNIARLSEPHTRLSF